MHALFSIRLSLTVVLLLFTLIGSHVSVQAGEIGLGLQRATQVTEITDQIRERLRGLREAARVHRLHVRSLHQRQGVIASGTALDADGPVIKVFTEHKDVAGIPELLDGIRVSRQVSGRIYALRGTTCDTSGDGKCDTTERWPLPVPIGVSTGHPLITAGTIGARVTDGTHVYALSNNHVLANLNDANLGDPALQPGAFDGGNTNAGDLIGTLSAGQAGLFKPIDFCECTFQFWGNCWQWSCPNNTMDAALALSTTAELGISTPTIQDHPYVDGSAVGYGVPSDILHSAYGDAAVIGDENILELLGTSVQKMGRTTRLTYGVVDTVEATVDVCYDADCNKKGRFVDQIIITPGTFSAGGDSGSLVLTNDDSRNPVGLLFAGSDTNTIANRIDLVLHYYGVSIDSGGNNINNPPLASFNWSADNLTTTFTDTSVDTDGNVVSWSWDFGDGNTSNLQNPVHNYAIEGAYTVSLTVTDDDNAIGDISDNVSVTAPAPSPNDPPSAAFNWSADNLTATFIDTSSDTDGSILSWLWDFGDGNTSTQQDPTHNYATNGTYTVSLTITDDDSATDTTSKDVSVSNPPASEWIELTFDDFEGGWGNWLDGGSDAMLSSSYAIGSRSLNLQDNSSTSESELASALDLTSYSELKIEFSYVVRSFENTEDFWLRFSNNGGTSWQTVKAFVNNVDFVDNGSRYNPVLIINSSDYVFSSNVKIKFECDASGNRDDVYIDNVRIFAK